MERVFDLTERMRRDNEVRDFMFYVGAQAAFPIGANGMRNAQGLEARLRQFDTPRLHWLLDRRKSAVAGGTTQSGNWGANVTDLSSIAAEWLVQTQAKTFLGRLPYQRVPFVTRTIKTPAPAATFVGPGVPIPVASITTGNTTKLKLTKVGTIAVVTNELVRVWAPGTRENLNGLLTRSVVRGMDSAALNPDVAAVTDERPASLLNGVPEIATLGSTVSAVLGQVQDMLEALVGGGSDLDSAVFAMHPYEAIRLTSLVTAEGVPAFPQLTALGGSISGIPVVVSVGCQKSGSPSERVFAVVDGAQILVADNGEIDVSASAEVAIQMDNAPTQDARTGAGSTAVSLYQTDSTAIKVTRTINWERAQDSAVAWLKVTG